MMADANPRHRFVVESREHLDRMATVMMALERGDAEQSEHVEALLRAAHSIKGGAGFNGLRNIERLAHTIETAVERIRDGVIVSNSEVVDRLLFALDRTSALVDDAEHSDSADISEPIERLHPLLAPNASTVVASPLTRLPSGLAVSPLTVAEPNVAPSEFPISHRVVDSWRRHTEFLYGVKLDWFECERGYHLPPLEVARRLEGAGTLLDSRTQRTGPNLLQGPPAPPLWYWAIISSDLGPERFAGALDIPGAAIVRLENVVNGPRPETVDAPPRPKASPSPGSLRIPVSLIDRMMGLAGELVLIRNQAANSPDLATAPVRQVMRRLDAITNELQDAALRMRMQPVATLFDRFPRLVRDLARQLGKQIDCVITGTDVELDKTILELLGDPLTHLVRNCCDHGIELPDQRVQSGKAPAGLIHLSARQERGQILIEIRDDGRGLDREAIKRKALQQGVRRSDELDRLSERQLYELILLSGFSTAANVTDLSGRGVGMDVVRTNLEQVGGTIEIDSTAGLGATFTLRLPLTLAIMPCLLMRGSGQRFVLPQRDIAEIVLLRPGDARLRIEYGDDQEVLRLRGRLLPLTRLADVLSRRQPFSVATRAELAASHHAGGLADAPLYAIVLRAGSHRFGLIVETVLGGAEVVVKPLHPLLRPLSVYTGATILGDGGVALILSSEGIARHSGIARSAQLEVEALPTPEPAGSEALLLFRCGAKELLAVPLNTVRRVVPISPEKIEHVGDRELVDVGGKAVNVLRLDRFLNLSPCLERGALFLILPRDEVATVGLLAAEIVDTPTLALSLDDRAFRAEGVLGTATIRGQIAVLLDFRRLVEMWRMSQSAPSRALPGATRRRILVVEDTAFFQRIVASCLVSAGHDVVTVGNGREAANRLAGDSFDLVVSDIEMPEMDGLELARYIRREVKLDNLPLLALSSLSGEEDRMRSLAAGFDSHEVKFDRESFLAAVQRLLIYQRVKSLDAGDLRRD